MTLHDDPCDNNDGWADFVRNEEAGIEMSECCNAPLWANKIGHNERDDDVYDGTVCEACGAEYD